MEEQIPVLLEVLGDAKDGYVNVLKSLDLDLSDNYSIRFRRRTIQVDASKHDDMLGGLDDLVHIIEAAERLKMSFLSHICQQSFAYLLHIFKSFFAEKPTILLLEGEDVADSMTSLVMEVTENMDYLLKLEDRHKRIQKGEEVQSSQEEDRVLEFSKTPPQVLRTVTSNSEAESEKETIPALVASSSNKGSTSDSPVASSKSGKRSHHKGKNCPLPKCTFHGYDIQRHLQVHVRRKELAEEGIDQLVSIAATGKHQRGKAEKQGVGKKAKPGRFRKWCPMPGCNRVVLNVGHHLTEGKSHGLKKGSVEYNVMIKSAKRYTGLGEIQTFLKSPESESTTSSDSEVETRKRRGKRRKVAVPSVSDTEAVENSEDKNEGDGKGGEKRGAVLPLDDGGPEGGDEGAEDNTGEDDEEEEDDDEESSESDQTDHEEAKVTSEEYFTDHKYKNNRHRWLVGFYEFLFRPSAGNKKDTIRLQHASQMRALLEHLDPGGDDITCLVEQEGDAVWKEWVRPMLDQKLKKPGTVNSYLTSYEKSF